MGGDGDGEIWRNFYLRLQINSTARFAFCAAVCYITSTFITAEIRAVFFSFYFKDAFYERINLQVKRSFKVMWNAGRLFNNEANF